MLDFLLHNTYVNIEGNYYKQARGVGTGSHSSPGYSDIIVDHIYCTAISTSDFKPDNLSIYVNDSWALWNHGEEKLKIFIKSMENLWDNIKFTYQMEENNSIIFLDMVIQREQGEY